MPIAFRKNAIGLPPCTNLNEHMRTNIMISSCLIQRAFCYLALSIALPAAKKSIVYDLPDPKFQIGDRAGTKKICNKNFGDRLWLDFAHQSKIIQA